MTQTILIIEDDEELSRLLQIDLKRHNFNVMVARNGLDGLEDFQETLPDLVVLDVALPLMDGFTVCERAPGNLACANFDDDRPMR
ncbi:MAG: response regulator [Anaerolineae bacterium]|nr:response regulator [Anaerolineae bacterium]